MTETSNEIPLSDAVLVIINEVTKILSELPPHTVVLKLATMYFNGLSAHPPLDTRAFSDVIATLGAQEFISITINPARRVRITESGIQHASSLGGAESILNMNTFNLVLSEMGITPKF